MPSPLPRGFRPDPTPTPPPATPSSPRAWIIPGALSLLALSVWLHRRKLIEAPRLLLDDFAFLIDSRDFPTAWNHALAPHNAHVVPAFRLMTAIVRHAAPSLTALPSVLAWSAWLGLALCAVIAGHLVWQETRSHRRSLLALALVLLSSVFEPVAAWWAGSQVTWAGAALLAALSAALAYTRTGRPTWLAACLLAACLAPWIWSGGYLAALVIPAAILHNPCAPPRRKTRCLLALAASLALVASSHAYGWIINQQILSNDHAIKSPVLTASGLLPRLARVPINTAHALAEALLLPNLGLEIDAPLPLPAALGLLLLAALALALALYALRLRPALNPLAPAGLALLFGGYALVYVFRSDLAWPALRPIVWYHGLPQLGLILILVGGWKRPQSATPLPRARGQAALRALLALALAAGWLRLQEHRTTRLWSAEVLTLVPRIPAPIAETALRMPPNPRARLIQHAYAQAQQNALGQLDLAQSLAIRLQLSRIPPADSWMNSPFPGWPPMNPSLSPADLIRTVPSAHNTLDPAAFQAAYNAERLRKAPLDPAPHAVP